MLPIITSLQSHCIIAGSKDAQSSDFKILSNFRLWLVGTIACRQAHAGRTAHCAIQTIHA